MLANSACPTSDCDSSDGDENRATSTFKSILSEIYVMIVVTGKN